MNGNFEGFDVRGVEVSTQSVKCLLCNYGDLSLIQRKAGTAMPTDNPQASELVKHEYWEVTGQQSQPSKPQASERHCLRK